MVLAKLMCLQMLAYSLPAHKEFRFLLPGLQLAIPFCGLGAATLLHKNNAKRNKIFALLLIFLQLPMIVYFSLYHQRAQLDVMNFLHQSRHSATTTATTNSILFLTPCHTTPFYSHVHRPLSMRFLDCSPPGMKLYIF